MERARHDGAGRVRDKGRALGPYGAWRGETVFILASGPSACKEDAQRAKEKGRVITVNCAIRLCESDAHYAGDHKWWDFYRDDWKDFRGLRFSINTDAVVEFDCIHVPVEGKRGLGKRGVATCGNSGYQATNLAYLLGARKICLIGFDMKPGKAHHFHGDHRGGTLTNPTTGLYRDWIKGFSELHEALAGEGVELVNCSRNTALTIPRASLDDC